MSISHRDAFLRLSCLLPGCVSARVQLASVVGVLLVGGRAVTNPGGVRLAARPVLTRHLAFPETHKNNTRVQRQQHDVDPTKSRRFRLPLRASVSGALRSPRLRGDRRFRGCRLLLPLFLLLPSSHFQQLHLRARGHTHEGAPTFGLQTVGDF